MISIRSLFQIISALSVTSIAFADKPGWTTYKPDGSVKARAESEVKDEKLIKREIFDSKGRLEFVEYPIYDDAGKRTGTKRVLPDGRPWPFDYPVFGVAAFGGMEKLKEDIKMIQDTIPLLDTKYPILEIVFLSRDHVEVKTGIVEGPLNAKGRYYDLKKQGDSWQNADKPGLVRGWRS
jgi:hypothetical protein